MGGMGSTRWGGHDRSAAIGFGHTQLRITQIRSLLANPEGGEDTIEWLNMTLTAVVTHRPDLVHEYGWACAELVLPGSWILLLGEPGGLAGTRWRFSCPRCSGKRESLFTDPVLIGEVWNLVAHGEEPVREWKCRDCAGLTYQARQLGPMARADLKFRKIVRKMGGDFLEWEVEMPPPPRPRGMRWTVYRSLRDEYIRAVEAYEETWSRSFRKDGSKLQARVRKTAIRKTS
jgi:hypothetical protein